jgi:hypothetical protein
MLHPHSVGVDFNCLSRKVTGGSYNRTWYSQTFCLCASAPLYTLSVQASACSALEQQWSTYGGRRALRAYEKLQLQQWKQSHPSSVLSATSAALAATLALSPKHMLAATFGGTFNSISSSSNVHRKGSVAPTSAQR